MRFERAMEWWLAGEDLAYYARIGISLAARFVRKQKGSARSIVEELGPSALANQDEEIYTEETVIDDYGKPGDEDHSERDQALVDMVRKVADATAGLKVLMAAYKAVRAVSFPLENKN